MSSTVEEPTQAERLEDVAVAGAGADDKEYVGDQSSGSASDGSVEAPSKEVDESVKAKADAGLKEKPPVPPQAPERSKAKVALIMGSLMVRDIMHGKFSLRLLLMNGLDRCLSCRSRYCESCVYHSLMLLLTST